MTGRLQSYYWACATLLLASVCRGLPAQAATNQFRPEWKKGQWWVIETDVVRHSDPAEAARLLHSDAPLEYVILKVLHKFVVSDVAKVADEDCWVIEVKLERLPPGAKDDTKGAPMWTLYIRQGDGTLARCDSHVRGGDFLATGEIVESKTFTFARHLPVVPLLHTTCPLEVLMTTFVDDKLSFLPSALKRLEYTDEFGRRDQRQVTEIVQDTVFGHKERVLILRVASGPRADEVREEKWVKGYPWWLTWQSFSKDLSLSGGPIRARLVRYGLFGEDGTTVKTPEWW